MRKALVLKAVANAMKEDNEAESNDLFYTAFSHNLLFKSNVNSFPDMSGGNAYHRVSLLTSMLIGLTYYHVGLSHSSTTKQKNLKKIKK